MAVLLKPPVAALRAPPRAVARQSIRKIGLCGAHVGSLKAAPWDDPTWELWGHASSRAWYHRELDRYFDMHPKACWTRGGKKTAHYPKWLAKNIVPIFMQEQYPEVPASYRYPKERVLMEFGGVRQHFRNQAAWMIALAFTEGVTHLGLFGVNYSSEGEYVLQRGSVEYWLGRAEERGVHVILPDGCSLLREPALLYGYESHDLETGKLKPEYRKKVWAPADTIEALKPGQTFTPAAPPAWLKEEIEQEEREYPTPDWSIWAKKKANGGVSNDAVAHERGEAKA